MGLRYKWSIAWGITQVAKSEGANLIFTCQSEREKEETENLLNGMGVAKAALETSEMYLASDLGELNIRINAHTWNLSFH